MMPGYTVLKTVADGANFGLIEWKPEAGNTHVDIRGVVQKTLVGTFLRLSDDQRYGVNRVHVRCSLTDNGPQISHYECGQQRLSVGPGQ